MTNAGFGLCSPRGRLMRLSTFAALFGLAAACGSDTSDSNPADGGAAGTSGATNQGGSNAGGASGNGGAGAIGSGGSAGSANGGAGASGSGGTIGLGGANGGGTSGASDAGLAGSSGTGGTSTSTGGSAGTGGATGTGGSTGAGGAVGTGGATGTGGSTGTGGAVGTGGATGTGGSTSTGGAVGTGGTSGTGGSAGAGGSGVVLPTFPPNLACTLPFGPVDVSTPTTVVGQGTHVCDEAALSAAVKKGGIITFDCGGPTTIPITSVLELPKTNTTIDGGGTVTLDGGGKTRIFHFDGGGYRTGSTVITLQHLMLQNGHATGTKLPPEPAPCSQGYDTDAGGGAILVVDGILHVIDCTFSNNAGQTPGPDVAGGAVYVNGSKGATIIGSRFTNNTCSNGGAVGSLNSDLAIYTTILERNTATGTGQNTIDTSTCSSPSGEVGDGGSGGAVYLDGGSDGDTVFCGDVFSKNHSNALGGAVFRVFDNAVHNLNVDVTTFDGNVADGPVGTTGSGPGAGCLYAHAATLRFRNSTLSGNSSPGCGCIQADGSTLDFQNVTLSGNVATDGIGGGICIFSNGGTLENCTLANNQALGGSSFSNFYGAALFGGNLTIDNTIFANNTTENSMGRMACAGGAPESGSNDVQWPLKKVVGGGDDSPCVTGITFADPVMGPLQDNGGPTLTQAPGAAASVIQVGTNCPAIDQTGKARGSPCTIGALEK